MSLGHVTDGLLSGFMHLSIAPDLEARATGRYGRDARTDWQGSVAVLEEVTARATPKKQETYVWPFYICKQKISKKNDKGSVVFDQNLYFYKIILDMLGTIMLV